MCTNHEAAPPNGWLEHSEHRLVGNAVHAAIGLLRATCGFGTIGATYAVDGAIAPRAPHVVTLEDISAQRSRVLALNQSIREARYMHAMTAPIAEGRVGAPARVQRRPRRLFVAQIPTILLA